MGIYLAPMKQTDERGTPDSVFDPLHQEFGFTLDVCASEANHKLPRYFTAIDNAIDKDWAGEICWMNPPYSQTGAWMRKAYEESLRGATVVCLVPSATDTKWWHEYAVKGEVRFVRGRIRFVDTPSSAPFPSAIIIFGRHNGSQHRAM